MERKIGEIFEYNDEWYQCVRGQSGEKCIGCSFKFSSICIYSHCLESERKDHTKVIFKKLEKVGEPFTLTIHVEERLVPMQEYKLYDVNFSKENDLLMYVSDYKHKRVAIEIKQNKEDMEEKKVKLKKEDIDFLYNKFIEIVEDCVVKGYNIDNVQHEFGKLFLIKDSYTKLNLKPFDLEAAKAGKPVCTRDGRKARIICFDRKIKYYPILALVTERDGNENAYEYSMFGEKDIDNSLLDADLMMLPEKHEGWINICKNADEEYYTKGVFNSEKYARNNEANYPGSIVATVKIEWEE